MTKNEYTYDEFVKEYPDDDACLEKIFQMTYGKMECCPKCKRTNGFVKIQTRKVYQCRSCYYQISPLAACAFKHCRIPLRKVFYALFVFTVSKNGISALELSRAIGVSPKTALNLLKKIRLHIVNDESPLSNSVECDEAMIGGIQENRHKNKRLKGTGGRSTVDKSMVFGMIERGGRVIAKVIPNAKMETLHPLILQHVEINSNLYTDEFPGYRGLEQYYTHEWCNHRNGYYRVGKASTNCMENFWSNFKRTLRSYISVSRKHLYLYLKEAVFRHNFRGNTNMFRELLSCLVY